MNRIQLKNRFVIVFWTTCDLRIYLSTCHSLALQLNIHLWIRIWHSSWLDTLSLAEVKVGYSTGMMAALFHPNTQILSTLEKKLGQFEAVHFRHWGLLFVCHQQLWHEFDSSSCDKIHWHMLHSNHMMLHILLMVCLWFSTIALDNNAFFDGLLLLEYNFCYI